jgi:hypothetical protein
MLNPPAGDELDKLRVELGSGMDKEIFVVQ